MPGAELRLQDPTAGGGNLLDALSRAARDATSGGGIFAFASVKGIDSLLQDRYLRRLAKSRGFLLVVGVDSITNAAALAALARAAKGLPKLTPRVLLHETPNLLHPKLCWFANGTRLTLVVGSGNLTPGGLMTNYEAFLQVQLDRRQAGAAQAEIDDFLRRWGDRLLSPANPRAIARAKRNTGSERSLLRSMQPAPELPAEPATAAPDTEVLVAEISKNVDERTQLDVGIEVFTGFFGARPEGGHIFIQAVDAAGSVGAIEGPRAIFPTKSHNYRFEAQAGAGRKYPAAGEGRPFGVFVRMPDGIFRYRLIWPQEPGHREMDELLTARKGAAKTRMRRATVSLSELAGAWPDSPLLEAA